MRAHAYTKYGGTSLDTHTHALAGREVTAAHISHRITQGYLTSQVPLTSGQMWQTKPQQTLKKLFPQAVFIRTLQCVCVCVCTSCEFLRLNTFVVSPSEETQKLIVNKVIPVTLKSKIGLQQLVVQRRCGGLGANIWWMWCGRKVHKGPDRGVNWTMTSVCNVTFLQSTHCFAKWRVNEQQWSPLMVGWFDEAYKCNVGDAHERLSWTACVKSCCLFDALQRSQAFGTSARVSSRTHTHHIHKNGWIHHVSAEQSHLLCISL